MRVLHRLAPDHNPACRVAHRTAVSWRLANDDPVAAPATAEVEPLPLAADGVSETADPVKRTDDAVRASSNRRIRRAPRSAVPNSPSVDYMLPRPTAPQLTLRCGEAVPVHARKPRVSLLTATACTGPTATA
jgi:hypothetical protein